MLLPDEILTEDAGRLFAEFKHWADEKIREHSGLATVADFWARLGMLVPDKINKKEAELMQNFARRAGYGIAPDMRYELNPKTWTVSVNRLFDTQSGILPG